MSESWHDPYAEDAEPQQQGPPAEPSQNNEPESPIEPKPGASLSLFEPEPTKAEEPFILQSFTPPPLDEEVRRFGLGWSAGIAFSGAIVFMVFVGWLVDLLMGTRPWGIVAGVILGALIGFFELFHISSRIFPNSTPPKVNPLLSSHDRQDPQDNAFRL
ncbi:MAG: AtpZ/AtpI family protein [Pyrinomonadaceae bacterium]|nr:AtpZ/AtpI family protein [Pyrinomonadaceae bacterium]